MSTSIILGTIVSSSVMGHQSHVLEAYLATYGQGVDCSYIRSDQCLFGTTWNVIKVDALPFFIATTISLYSRAASANAKRYNKSPLPYLLPALIGAGVFFVSTHFSQWNQIVSGHGPAMLLPRLIQDGVHEVTAPITFIQAVRDGNSASAVENWIHDELVRIGGSFYKLTSLYPKVLLIFLVAGVGEYLWGSR